MKFSVVMATYDDFSGVYFTVMNLLMHHSPWVGEIIIVDNNPRGKEAERLRGFVHNAQDERVRYEPFGDVVGTAAPRDRAMQLATGTHVVCLDSHVLPVPGFFPALAEFFRENPACWDLVHGPMLYDSLRGEATHLSDVWNNHFWGVWGHDPNPAKWFEIPAHGLGMFACQRDTWLGFNPAFREFGGEEWYIHEKYRNEGNRVWCVRGAKWVHRFNENAPYPHTLFAKVKNYITGHRELGLDMTRLREHFRGAISDAQWNELAGVPCTACTLAGAWDWAKKTHNDISEHCDTLRSLAAGKVVVDFGSRPYTSTVALAMGKPSHLHIISDAAIGPLLSKLGQARVEHSHYVKPPRPIPCDVLFLDTEPHTGGSINATLDAWEGGVRERIVLHDTVTFGDIGQDGKPGLLHCLKRDGWTVEKHYPNNNGLTVMVRT